MPTNTLNPTLKGYRVKVVGTYFARSGESGKEKISKNYELEANIPSLDSALSIVKNKILTPVLSKKYSDYIMYRTYHITEIVPLDEKSRLAMRRVEIQYMDWDSLLDYIQDNALPVDPRYYPDLFKLRVAVQEAKEDPEGYVKRLEGKKDDLELDLEISRLNPDLYAKKQNPPKPSASIASGSSKPTSRKVKDHPKPIPVSEDISSTPKKIKKPLTKKRVEQQTKERVEGLRQDMIKEGEHSYTTIPDVMDEI